MLLTLIFSTYSSVFHKKKSPSNIDTASFGSADTLIHDNSTKEKGIDQNWMQNFEALESSLEHQDLHNIQMSPIGGTPDDADTDLQESQQSDSRSMEVAERNEEATRERPDKKDEQVTGTSEDPDKILEETKESESRRISEELNQEKEAQKKKKKDKKEKKIKKKKEDKGNKKQKKEKKDKK